MKTSVLSVDIETFSDVDLIKCGVYAYVASPAFEIIMFQYSYDGLDVRVIDLLQGEEIPQYIIDMLTSKNYIKTAFNAAFERTCLAKHLNTTMPPEQWRCTSVLALYNGFPNSLANVGKVMNLEKQKLSHLANPLKYFCVPCKPSEVNGGRTRNLPHHAPDKWEVLKEYGAGDVVAEMAVYDRLHQHPFTPLPDNEQKLWELDQLINDSGIRVDVELAKKAIQGDEDYGLILEAEAKELTGMSNPNSIAQIKTWFLDNEFMDIQSLNKDDIPGIIATLDNPVAIRVLELRQAMSKTSISKYDAILRCVCPDNRVRGILQFMGANRTGRWAGRLVQVQNLPKNHLSELALARQLLLDGDFDTLEMAFEEALPDILSQLIRTAFIPDDGCNLVIADFSAIEARVIAWLAGEDWRLEVFATHGKIYEASASAMFKVPMDTIVKGHPNYALRAKGKVAELGCGFGGSKGALINMGALEQGIPEKDLMLIIKAWRAASPNIVKLWTTCEDAAMKAVTTKKPVNIDFLRFTCEGGMLFITLPSGRRLAYVNPRIELEKKFDRMGLTYEGMNQTTKQWERMNTFGGKIAENITQAIARDCLAVALLALDKAGYNVSMHIHDEVVISCDSVMAEIDLESVCDIMGQPIPWAPGLLLKADGFITPFYKKDD